MTPDSKDGSDIIHEVPHISQQYNWDCGVTCVLMLLNEQQREYFCNNFSQICNEEGFGQSTWTIDLCYLLKRFNIDQCMYTTMAGVNDEYKNHDYYNKIIDIDRTRITQRFAHAASNGIEVIEQEINMDSIINHLKKHGPVILLVNASLLVCDICKYNKLKVEFRKCFGVSYKGHYILLVGVCGRRVIYRDPARTQQCAAKINSLKIAAKSTGTDDDCILVYKNR